MELDKITQELIQDGQMICIGTSLFQNIYIGRPFIGLQREHIITNIFDFVLILGETNREYFGSYYYRNKVDFFK